MLMFTNHWMKGVICSSPNCLLAVRFFHFLLSRFTNQWLEGCFVALIKVAQLEQISPSGQMIVCSTWNIPPEGIQHLICNAHAQRICQKLRLVGMTKHKDLSSFLSLLHVPKV
jgi:hypothetical protein